MRISFTPSISSQGLSHTLATFDAHVKVCACLSVFWESHIARNRVMFILICLFVKTPSQSGIGARSAKLEKIRFSDSGDSRATLEIMVLTGCVFFRPHHKLLESYNHICCSGGPFDWE